MSNESQDELFYPMDETNPRILTLGDAIDLPQFTLAAATTDIESLDGKSLVNRFKYHWVLQESTIADLIIIGSKVFQNAGISASFVCLQEIALRSRGTPRLAKKYCHRAIDFVRFFGRSELDLSDVSRMFSEQGIDEIGCDILQRQYLTKLLESDKPIGREPMAAMLGISMEQLSRVIEPHLWRMGLITSTNKGRELTEKGHQHIMTVGGFRGEL